MPFLVKNFKDFRKEKQIEKSEEELKVRQEYIQKEKEYLMGRFDPSKRDGFVLVAKEHSSNPYAMHLREETYQAYINMHNAAKEDGIEIKISSGARNFDSQKYLWDEKWKTLKNTGGQAKFRKILEYMAVPGASRHHWGTDIDINGANPEYFDTVKGKKEYKWLRENASRFGFCQTYDIKNSSRPLGYNEEKWHWSYLPLARFFTKEYAKIVTIKDIEGFLGAEYAESFNVIKNYALSINSDCI